MLVAWVANPTPGAIDSGSATGGVQVTGRVLRGRARRRLAYRRTVSADGSTTPFAAISRQR